MQVDDTARAEKPTLTDMLRVRFKGVVDPAARFIGRLGITPNMLTLTGLAGNIVAAFFLSRGELLVGGLIILLVGPLDALDGALARLRDEPSPFGAFLDSVTDRYSELFIFGNAGIGSGLVWCTPQPRVRFSFPIPAPVRKASVSRPSMGC
jgi:hypothetical protein